MKNRETHEFLYTPCAPAKPTSLDAKLHSFHEEGRGDCVMRDCALRVVLGVELNRLIRERQSVR